MFERLVVVGAEGEPTRRRAGACRARRALRQPVDGHRDRPLGTGAAAHARPPSPDAGADRRTGARSAAARVAASAGLDRRGPRGDRGARAPPRSGRQLGASSSAILGRCTGEPGWKSPSTSPPIVATTCPNSNATSSPPAASRAIVSSARRPSTSSVRPAPIAGCGSSSPPSVSPSSSHSSAASSPSTNGVRPSGSAGWRPPASSLPPPTPTSPTTRNAACCSHWRRSTRPGRATGRCCPRPRRPCTAPCLRHGSCSPCQGSVETWTGAPTGPSSSPRDRRTRG